MSIFHPENDPFRVTVERFSKIKAARQNAAKDLPQVYLRLKNGALEYASINLSQAESELLTQYLVNNHNLEKAALEFPSTQKLDGDGNPLDAEKHFQAFIRSLIRAVIRRQVSETMYQQDQLDAEREAVQERQINRYYQYEVKNPELHGHIEAPHGILIPLAGEKTIEIEGGTQRTLVLDRLVQSRSEELSNIKAWHDHPTRKFVTYEQYTAHIATSAPNYAYYRRPRRHADVNQLPIKGRPALRSEKKIYTREFNLNALQAQRDINARILRATNNLNEHGKAIRPHLAIHLHKKSDAKESEGDIIIGAERRDGKGPLHPAIVTWVQLRLAQKIQEKTVMNKAGEPASVLIAESGSYSGSPALTHLRYGDDLLGFQGFGEMLQCLQLECSQHVVKNNREKIEKILQELLQEFSDTFRESRDLEM